MIIGGAQSLSVRSQCAAPRKKGRISGPAPPCGDVGRCLLRPGGGGPSPAQPVVQTEPAISFGSLRSQRSGSHNRRIPLLPGLRCAPTTPLPLPLGSNHHARKKPDRGSSGLQGGESRCLPAFPFTGGFAGLGLAQFSSGTAPAPPQVLPASGGCRPGDGA